MPPGWMSVVVKTAPVGGMRGSSGFGLEGGESVLKKVVEGTGPMAGWVSRRAKLEPAGPKGEKGSAIPGGAGTNRETPVLRSWAVRWTVGGGRDILADL